MSFSILSSSPARWTLPFGVLFTLFATFDLADKVLSKSIKKSLADFFRSEHHISALEQLPAVSETAFEFLFGEKHFSRKCVSRSIGVSLFAIFIAFLFSFMYNPNALVQFVTGLINGYQKWVVALQGAAKTKRMGDQLAHLGTLKTFFFLILLWLFWCVVPDYVSLFKSRVVILLFKHRPPSITGLIMTMISDFIFGIIVFFVSASAFQAFILTVFLSINVASSSFSSALLLLFVSAPLIFSVELGVSTVYGGTFFSIPLANLFWASLVPSVWLWIYILSALTARVVSRNRELARALGK